MSHGRDPDDRKSGMVIVRRLAAAVLKTGLSFVPGGGVALVVTEEGQKLAQELSLDLDKIAQAALADELPRLRRLLANIENTAATPEEALEIALNVVQSYPRTLRREKRRLLTNTLVNGLAADDWNAERERYFVRAVNDLEPEHIAVLERYAKETLFGPRGVFRAPSGTTSAGYVHQLHRWQFLATAPHADSPDEFVVSRLGTEFLKHLWDRECPSNPYDGWPQLVDLREASMGFLIAANPVVREILGYELRDGAPYVLVRTPEGDERQLNAAEVDELLRPQREAKVW